MSKNILIVDGDPNARMAMSITLRHAGYKVSSAVDAEEAASLLDPRDGANHDFDLVIIDAETPGSNGRMLTEALKRNCSTIPSLMVSNFSDKAFFIDLVSHGHGKFIENLCSKGEAAMRIWDISIKYTGKRISHEIE